MSQGRQRVAYVAGRVLRALALAGAMVAVVSLSFAQAQTRELSISIDGFSSQDWPQPRSIMTVLDAEGEPVAGLTEANVLARINEDEMGVTSVSRGVDSNLPSYVVLALDASAVMAGAALEQEKAAAHQFVDSLAAQDSIAILAYSDAPSLVQAFTQDRQAAHAAIDTLTTGGGNGLYKAATQSVLLGAASVQTGRRAVVLVSSAADGATDDPAQSLVAAKGLGVPVFIAGVGPAIDRAYLQQLTDAAGGRFAEASNAGELAGLLADVSELLRNQYVVTFDASGLDVDTTHLVDLHVEVSTSDSTGTVTRIVCPGVVCAVFKDLEAGATLSAEQQIVAEVVSSEQIRSVSLLIDGQAVETLQLAPYEFDFDPESFGAGEHTLALSVTTSSGSQQLGQVGVEFDVTAGGGEESSSSMLPIVAIVGILIVVLLAVLFLILRRRKRGSGAPAPQGPPPEPSEPISVFIAKQRARNAMKDETSNAPSIEVPEPTLGYLRMTEGPLAGQTFGVGAKPISIGSGHRCEIQLPLELDGYEVPSEYARVWIRSGQLMVHELRRLTAMGAVGGRWEFLAAHETFAIGPCVFRFDLDEEEPAAPSEPVPNVLRDKPDAEATSGPASGSAPSGIEPVPIAPMQAPRPGADEGTAEIFRDPPKTDDTEMEQAAG